MKTKFILAAVVSTFVIQHLSFAQGTLTPPGAPAPTMKSLAQIEARTPISSLPVTINSPGSYYLTANLTATASNAIVIAVSGVTLDLNGFSITSTVANALNGGSAILLNDGANDVAIYNGHIRSGVTNSAGGSVFGGSGFGFGINSGFKPYNVRVKDLSIEGVLYDGIHLAFGYSVVESCTITVAGGYGIYAGSVSDSIAWNCGSYGISATTTHNCKGYAIGIGNGLAAATANDCYGQSSGSGFGLSADAANNCYGYSSGNGTGLLVSAANNSYGFGSSGDGIRAQNVNNCYGYSGNGSGYGIRANTAQNSYGYNDSSGTGLFGVELAIGCSGFSNSGTGLSAYIANSCHGSTTSGTAQIITYKYNMP